MRTFLIHRARFSLIAAVVVLLVGATYLANSAFFSASTARAGTGDNLSGWAWSSNIGWISLNSTNEGSGEDYGVGVDAINRTSGGTGDFAGEAWSSNVGWISFDRTQTGNPPGAPFNTGVGPIAQINWSTGNITGWARALVNGGGWDGWIKFAGVTTGGDPYGVSITGNGFSGYAWGGDVVGWIDFDPKIDTNGDGIIDENDGAVDNSAQISAPPCVATMGYDTDDPDMIWGSCTPTTTCGPGDEGTTLFNQSGVVVGACLVDGVPTGGTTVVVCGTGTLVCPVTSGPVSTSTKTHWWQF